jgi:hypothetical protein
VPKLPSRTAGDPGPLDYAIVGLEQALDHLFDSAG